MAETLPYDTVIRAASRETISDRDRIKIDMILKERVEQMGTLGHIVLWLLGIPMPILFLFFLLRDCS